ncbi:hypothetical protein SISNIDRAFT_436715 [Sistotremastrum niveocremeum HHB9708]|uniref:Uncharacterized protein n=1 Tax=Sistotremastrum niveocremeum HHB9708 TaxID=1314777 RepID=A0A164ZQY2_9AGAM|nr:hypothetical protein SISNIDRAFT_436715 [Sistotremastrum niveocremeum HHB9708]
MEFTPRHKQPFTFEEALSLDVSTITAEIARLQNSLALLNDTQTELQSHLTTDPPDKDLVEAFQENKAIISNPVQPSDSQNERILMLRLALQSKGGVLASNPHYALPADPPPESTRSQTEPEGFDEDGGITL